MNKIYYNGNSKLYRTETWFKKIHKPIKTIQSESVFFRSRPNVTCDRTPRIVVEVHVLEQPHSPCRICVGRDGCGLFVLCVLLIPVTMCMCNLHQPNWGLFAMQSRNKVVNFPIPAYTANMLKVCSYSALFAERCGALPQSNKIVFSSNCGKFAVVR